MAKLETKPLGLLKPDPNQPRKHFDEAGLRLLGESIRKKQLQPILAKPDGTIIAGERRYRAAMLVGLPTLLVIVTDEPLTEAEIRALQLTENIHRADLTGHEKWQACRELLELNPGWQGKDLAEHLHLDPSSVTRLLSPSKCIPAAQEALKEDKIGIAHCYAISKAPPEAQAGLLALRLSGATREAMDSQVRRKRASSMPAVRASKIKIVLTSGASVTISGADLSLDDAIEAVKEATKEMTKGRDIGLDCKTIQAVAKDKAKAGV